MAPRFRPIRAESPLDLKAETRHRKANHALTGNSAGFGQRCPFRVEGTRDRPIGRDRAVSPLWSTGLPRGGSCRRAGSWRGARLARLGGMSAQADDPLPEAGKLRTGRVVRTARVGGLVTGQGLRWARMRTANRVRTPERAAAAQSERTAALVQRLVHQLGQMRGAAMKVGQMISMVEFDGLPEDERGRAATEARRAPRRRPARSVRGAREADAPGVRRSARARVLRL